MRSTNTTSRISRLPLPILLVIVIAIALVLITDANAVDGNYSSPYASQWDSRGGRASISDSALLGIVLMTLNAVAAAFYFLRDTLRRRRRAA